MTVKTIKAVNLKHLELTSIRMGYKVQTTPVFWQDGVPMLNVWFIKL